ncbi:hypothetical protein KAR91_62860 [Candidatus Pacearchaeota archaeon]|nr:hypothetical protein [Candidatus Pacearchaeota archaeon]
MRFNNQEYNDDGYEADSRMHAAKDDALMERKPIEGFTIYNNHICYVEEVRELELYTAELEKKLEIAVDGLKAIKKATTEFKHGKTRYWSLDACRSYARNILNQLKGEAK